MAWGVRISEPLDPGGPGAPLWCLLAAVTGLCGWLLWLAVR